MDDLKILEEENGQEFKCLQCASVFKTRSHLIQHSLTHVGIRVYMCETCKEMFHTSELLKEHSLTHLTTNSAHPTSILSAASVVGPFLAVTPLAISTALLPAITAHSTPTNEATSASIRHTTNSLPKKPREKVSERVSDGKFMSMMLSRNSSHSKKVACRECGKMISKVYIKNHQMIHLKVKRYECEFCKKKFTHKSTLYNHMSVHNGKKFECKVCKRAFTRRSYLTFHAKVCT